MIDGFKNREVAQERYESALNILTQAERNEYVRDGNITVDRRIDICGGREVEERMTGRHEAAKNNLEEILGAEYYSVGTTSDGVPFTHFINFDYGLVSVIRFSDNTIHVFCKDKKYLSYLRKRLDGFFEMEFIDDFVRLNIGNPITIDDKINKIKQQLNS